MRCSTKPWASIVSTDVDDLKRILTTARSDTLANRLNTRRSPRDAAFRSGYDGRGAIFKTESDTTWKRQAQNAVRIDCTASHDLMTRCMYEQSTQRSMNGGNGD